MEPYEIFLHEEVVETIKKTRGESRRQIQSVIMEVAENPSMKPDVVYEDRKGRVVGKFRTTKHVLDVTVDHPMKAIVVLRVLRLRQQT